MVSVADRVEGVLGVQALYRGDIGEI